MIFRCMLLLCFSLFITYLPTTTAQNVAPSNDTSTLSVDRQFVLSMIHTGMTTRVFIEPLTGGAGLTGNSDRLNVRWPIFFEDEGKFPQGCKSDMMCRLFHFKAVCFWPRVPKTPRIWPQASSPSLVVIQVFTRAPSQPRVRSKPLSNRARMLSCCSVPLRLGARSLPPRVSTTIRCILQPTLVHPRPSNTRCR